MKVSTKLFGRLILIVGLCLVIIAAAVAVVSSQSSQANQQRPRIVSGNQNSSPTPNNQQPANPPGDEVSEGDVLRVETQLVSVPAAVTDKNGRPLSSLRQEDFLVLEDGKPQRLTNFSTTEAPFEIALLLDTSGSTREELGLIRDAANAFVKALRPGDRIAIVAFNNEESSGNLHASVEVLKTLTDNRALLRNAIDKVRTSNGTPYYDALQKISDQLFRDPPTDQFRGRRAVVALTDGVDSSSNIDFDQARTRLLRTGVATYFIQVSTEDYVEDRLLKDCEDDGRLTLSAKQLERFRRLFVPTAQREDYQDFCRLGQFERMDISRQLYNLARHEMNELAKASGGKNFAATSLQDARAAFAQVANEIGTQYSLGYYPTNKVRDGRYRKITVQIRGVKDATVRARDGYYAPKQ